MKAIACVLSACVLCAGGAATLAAPAQDTTLRAGEPTQARVWIQNRGVSEAVPVALQPLASDAPPLRVEMTGTPTVTIGPTSVLQARAARQAWEYRALNIPTGQDIAALLNTAGPEGWETTGVSFAVQGGAIIVMKRPQ